MRLSQVVHAAVIMTVVGTCAAWGVDAPQSATPAASATPVAVESRSVVNARTALGLPIHELNVDAVPFSRVINFLRDVSGANIVVNWKVLEAAGVTRDTPVSLQVRELTLRKMLQLVLDQASPAAQLTFSADSNVLEITTQDEADKVLVTRVYVVDDLVMTDNQTAKPPNFDLTAITQNGSTTGGSGGGGGGSSGQSLFSGSNTDQNNAAGETTQKRGEDLVALVRDVVRPTIWKENGGIASIRYFSGKLIVTAPVSVQEAIGGPMLPEGGQRFGM